MLWFLLLFLLLSLWLLLLFLVFSLHSKRQPKRGGTMAAIFFFFSSCYCDGCCYFHVGLTREANFQLFFFFIVVVVVVFWMDRVSIVNSLSIVIHAFIGSNQRWLPLRVSG